MRDYRTQEQRETMAENVLNGNRKDAGQNGADFGFYAQDLLNFKENADNEGGISINWDDLVLLAEMIAEARAE